MAPTTADEIAESNVQPESQPLRSADRPVSVPAVSVPANEEIAKLAYSLWEARGGAGGSAEEDWLTAEAELRQLPA
jgi:hypothetical protein